MPLTQFSDIYVHGKLYCQSFWLTFFETTWCTTSSLPSLSGMKRKAIILDYVYVPYVLMYLNISLAGVHTVGMYNISVSRKRWWQ